MVYVNATALPVIGAGAPTWMVTGICRSAAGGADSENEARVLPTGRLPHPDAAVTVNRIAVALAVPPLVGVTDRYVGGACPVEVFTVNGVP